MQVDPQLSSQSSSLETGPEEALPSSQPAPPRDPNAEELEKIAQDRDFKLHELSELITYISSSKNAAEDDDRRFEEEQIARYSAKYLETGLPVVKHLMKIDETFIRSKGLITATRNEGDLDKRPRSARSARPRTARSTATSKSTGSSASQSSSHSKSLPNVRTVSKPKHRTDSGVRYDWQPNVRDWRSIKMAASDIIEEFDEDIATRSARKNRMTRLQKADQWRRNPISPMVQQLEQKALHDMNERINYLHNPRYTISPNRSQRLPATYETLQFYGRSQTVDEGADVKGSLINTRSNQKGIPPRRIAGENKKQSESAPLLCEKLPTAENAQTHTKAIPSTIRFTDYQPHKKYTATLELKNVSMNSQRFTVTCRAPTTKSEHFSIKRISSPTDNYGLVAPGMSCFYTVTFQPDTLADYTDFFIVHQEQAAEFAIPVIASRDPPILNLPSILDCGPCQAGCSADIEWDLENTGGPGKFLVLRRDEAEDGTYDLRTIWNDIPQDLRDRKIDVGPFKISPSYMVLDNLSQIQLLIQYSPYDITDDSFERYDSEEFVLACDNCEVIRVPINGLAQVPRVKLLSTSTSRSTLAPSCDQLNVTSDSGVSEIHAGQSESDVVTLTVTYESELNGAENHIDFAKQNTQGRTVRTIVVRNLTLLQLPFKWRTVDNPGDTRPRTARTVTGDPNKSTVKFGLENDRVPLWIKPNKGVLSPESDQTFIISFTPKETKAYDIRAELYLLATDGANAASSNQFQPSKAQKSATNEVSDGIPPGERLSLTLKCTGIGVPYDIEVHPCFVHVPYAIAMGNQHQASLRLTNWSISQVRYGTMIENLDPTIMEVEVLPPTDILEVNACNILKITFRALFPGKVQGRLVMLLDTGDVLIIPIQAEVKARLGTLDIEQPIVDFGLFPFGESRTIRAPLTNTCGVGVNWMVAGYNRESGVNASECHDVGNAKDRSSQSNPELVFEPSFGFLESGATIDVNVTYRPTECQRLRGVLEISTLRSKMDKDKYCGRRAVDDDDRVIVSCLDVRAEVQTPLACLDQCCIELPHGYFEIPTKTSTVLKNLTFLHSAFNWMSVPTPDNNNFDVTFEPKSGILGPGESKIISIELFPRKIGVYRNLLFACEIKDMVEGDGFVGLNIAIDIGGLEIIFATEKPAVEVSQSTLLSFRDGGDENDEDDYEPA